MNLGSLLKILGLKIPPETVAKIEAFISRIPAMVSQVAAVVNQVDERVLKIERTLQLVEAQQREILEVLKKHDPDGAGIGYTQLALERGELGANDGILGDAGGRLNGGSPDRS